MKREPISESMAVGLLLALAGGILDAYSYLNRGEVFATAETGNIVQLSIHLSRGEWGDAFHYLLPISAFALGVITAEAIRRRVEGRAGRLRWQQPILLAECAALVVERLASSIYDGSPLGRPILGSRHDKLEFPPSP